MRVTRWFLLLAFVAFTASMAMADGVDPKFTLKGGCCSIPVTDGTFSFVITPNHVTAGEFTIDFVNRSFDATSLELIVSGLPSSLVFSCGDFAGGPFFTNCGSTFNSETGQTTIDFFGMDDGHPGILAQTCTPGTDGDADDCTGSNADFIIDVTQIPAGFTSISVSGSLPEPATGFSLLIGLIALAAWQILRGAKATA